MAKLKCSSCKSPAIQILATDVNVKSVKTKVRVPLNPFSPIKKTVKVKKKKSAGKMLLGFFTGGTSLWATGIRDNKSNEYHCTNCGNVWRGK